MSFHSGCTVRHAETDLRHASIMALLRVALGRMEVTETNTRRPRLAAHDLDHDLDHNPDQDLDRVLPIVTARSILSTSRLNCLAEATCENFCKLDVRKWGGCHRTRVCRSFKSLLVT